MKKVKRFLSALIVIIPITSCTGEAKEKLRDAKQSVSNVTNVAKNAQEAKEDIEKLKDALPLTNEQLKEWLPESLNGWQRSSFSVGKTGYMNIASIEGGFTNATVVENKGEMETVRQQFSVSIVDGAGPTGSVIIAGLSMAGKMDMEEETEYKHTKGVTMNGIRAQQTFHKKRNETRLQFVYEKRFGVMINGVNLDADKTWAMVESLDFDGLVEMGE